MNADHESFYAKIDWLMPSLAEAAAFRREGNPEEALGETLKVIRARLRKVMPAFPRLDLCDDLREQADRLLERRVVLLNEEIMLDEPVDWGRLAATDGQRNWHLGYSYWLNALAATYAQTGDEKYARQWRIYVEEFLDHCPYAVDTRGYWPTRPMLLNDLQTCNLGENGGPRHKEAEPKSQHQWMSLSCHFRIETWLSNLARLVDSPHIDDKFFIRVLESLLNDHVYVCVMNPRENTPNQFTAVTLSLLKLSVLLPEYRDSASTFLVAWERLKRVFSNNLLPDGSDLEQSPDYNCFLLDLCVELLELLEDAPESRRRIIIEAARKRLRFLVAILSPDGTLPPIAKGHAEDKREHFLNLAKILKDTDSMLALSEGGGCLRHSVTFPYGGYTCIRNGHSHLLFKASGMGSGHMHEDCLSFILWHKGEELLTDPSHYTYNTSTKDEVRLNEWALHTSAHNCVCVDGHGQNRMAVRRQWPRRDADVPYLRAIEQEPLPFRACADETFSFVEGCYNNGYAEDLSIDVAHHRSVIQVSGHGWLVLDRFSGDTTNRVVQQHWHLSAAFDEDDVALMDNREVRTTRNEGVNIRILQLDVNPSKPHILWGSMNPVGGWTFPKYGKKVPSVELVWESRPGKEAVIATWIEPVTKACPTKNLVILRDENSVLWSTLDGIEVKLTCRDAEGLLQIPRDRELHWNLAIGGKSPLPGIPAE
jgi:hypothetical protein